MRKGEFVELDRPKKIGFFTVKFEEFRGFRATEFGFLRRRLHRCRWRAREMVVWGWSFGVAKVQKNLPRALT